LRASTCTLPWLPAAAPRTAVEAVPLNLLLRLLAGTLAVLGVAPLWRLLVSSSTGQAGVATAAEASAHGGVLWNGLLICAVPGIVAALFFDGSKLDAMIAKVAAPLRKPTTLAFALVLSVMASALAALIAYAVMGATPTLIDSYAQLLHARYIAEGMLAGPVDPNSEFWHIQQTVLTPAGWVSQYPPGHVVLLAIGMMLGLVWLVGPLAWGAAVLFTTLALHELVEDVALARFASLLAALSPFGLALSGAFMSHIPAAACAAAALYFLARARRGGWLWSATTGFALGALFAMRPLTAVALGAAAAVFMILEKRPLMLGAMFVAAVPALVAVAAHNAQYFGHPLRFGYTAALGPAGGLGFGTDPWGNTYGIVEALAYTSAELTTLSLYLFETPLPFVLLIGLYFAFGQRTRGEWLLFAWCALPVLANLFYWHHGLWMGPRMLADVGVMWAALGIISLTGLIGGMRRDWRIAGRYSPRAFATVTVLATVLFGAVFLVPGRLGAYRLEPQTRALLRAPRVEEPSLVFVHGGWTARIGMRLAAHGMRLDSVETALRQNPTCRVHAFADSFAGGAKAAVVLDFDARATDLPLLAEITPGNRIRVAPGEVLDAACAEQVRADQAGVIDVTPLVWQGDLPGTAAHGALFVRDMGPEANRRLIAEHEDRRAMMLIPHADSVALVPYTIAERAIWGDRQQ
jgi:hypothetical protein